MATVRCPACQRVLHLPDNREVQTGQCPLCQTTFSVGHKAVPLVESSARIERIAPLPAVPRETPQEIPEASRSSFDFDRDSSPTSASDRKKLSSASGWLKAMAGLGLGQLATCGCCDWAMIDHNGDLKGCFLFVLPLVFIALCLVWSAAESIQRRRNLALVRFGAVVAFLVGAFLLLLGLLGVFAGLAGPSHGPEGYYLIAGIFRLAAGICGLTGALMTLSALKRPGVKALFERGVKGTQ